MKELLKEVFPPPDGVDTPITGNSPAEVIKQRGLEVQAQCQVKGSAVDMDNLRIGPREIGFDLKGNVGSSVFHKDCGALASDAGFVSCVCNTAVATGKWMYEVSLVSPGLAQIGWATPTCEYTRENGVGDSRDSYAYDGFRLRKWNSGVRVYGEEWTTGDIIGTCLDLSEGTITYYRNGRSMGVAYDKVRIGHGFGYKAAVSASKAQLYVINYGQQPMQYPVEGFRPLQDEPVQLMKYSNYLINSLSRLWASQLFVDGSQPAQARVMLCEAAIFNQLQQGFDSIYIANAIILPFLLAASEAQLRRFIKGAAQYLTDRTFSYLVGDLLQAISSKIMHYFAWEDEATQLTELTTTLFENATWFEKLCVFFKDKQFANGFQAMFLSRLLAKHDTWFLEHTDPVAQCLAGAAVLTDAKLHEFERKSKRLDTARARLLQVLLRQVPTQGTFEELHSHPIMKWIVAGYSLYISQPRIKQKSSAFCVQAAANISFALLSMLHSATDGVRLGDIALDDERWARYHFNAGIYLASCYDHFPNDRRHDISRLGGSLSTAKRVRQRKVDKGELHSLGIEESGVPLCFWLVQYAAVAILAMNEVYKHCRTINDNVMTDSVMLRQAVEREASPAAKPEDAEALVETVAKIKKTFSESTRQCVGFNLTHFSPWRRELCMHLENVLLDQLFACEKAGALGVFPVFVHSAIMDLSSLLQSEPTFSTADTVSFDNYWVKTPERKAVLEKYFRHLGVAYSSKDVVLPDVLSALTAHIKHVTLVPAYAQVLAELPDAIAQLGTGMLATFEETPSHSRWVQAADVVTGMWGSNGFGFWAAVAAQQFKLHEVPGDMTSLAFCTAFCERCFEGEQRQSAIKFLNTALNIMNWTVSETWQLVEVIRETDADEGTMESADQKFSRCMALFDANVNICRTFECVAALSKSTFDTTQEDSLVLVIRVIELMVHLIDRCLYAPNIETLSKHFFLSVCAPVQPLLPAIGVLLALDKHHSTTVQKVAENPLMKRPLMDKLRSLLDDVESPMSLSKLNETERSSFTDFLDRVDVQRQEQEQLVQQMMAEREKRQTRVSQGGAISSDEDDDTCPICCALPLEVSFNPCHHKSCKLCITRHLQNNDACFFCNATVESVTPIDPDAV
eukprot:m.357244 g.357244  ORF g.357244 m.357244 type:complete len:1134 (+) comp17750_c0_seq1:148-3549(+)